MLRKFVAFLSMVFAVVTLSSCLVTASDGEVVSEKTKLLICVSDKISSKPRTVFPSVDLEKFTRLELNGSKNGEEKVLLGSWNGVSEIDYVLLSEGTWDFELLAYIGSAVYKAEENNLDIKTGTNTVTFTLALQDIGTGSGCIKYTLYYPVASESGRTTVESVLYTITDYETRKIVKSESNLTRNTGYDAEHGDYCYVECDESISAGKYIIKFSLYSGSVKLINSYEEAVNVISGNVESIGSHWIDKLNDNEQSDDSDITVSVSDLASLNLENIPTHTKIIVNGVFSADGSELAYLVRALENANGKVSVDLSDTTGLVALGEERFSGARKLVSLVLPDTVETISESSFYNSSIKYIYIPSSVTCIENYAFEMSDLEEVEFQTPCNVESIGTYCFRSTNIKKFEILPKLTSIGSYAFSYCSNLREITFPEEYALTEIGSYAFAYMPSVETFEIPTGVTSIGSNAFAYCAGLKSITFEEPCSLTEIGSDAFAHMPSVETFEIPTGITSIGSDAFSYCVGLKSITFEEPCSLTEIEYYAFANMPSVEVFEIPTGVTSIGNDAFSGCEGLREITFPYTIKTIHSEAFYNCDAFDTANYYGTEAMWNSVSGSEYILANVNFLGIDSIPNLDMNFEILVEDIAISGVEKNGSVYTFTADECFDSYSWKIDSKYAEETSNVFIIDAATLPAGYHYITVYAKKGILIYSASKYIKSEAVEEDSDQNTETDPETPEPIEPETGDIDIFIY
ncbi:MAG: leucine-rich repeat domain-containing protein [Spirochaetia bacterium]|nr:leucine-rich repeat domain-containing protein [Spirochaetia bacterium]